MTIFSPIRFMPSLLQVLLPGEVLGGACQKVLWTFWVICKQPPSQNPQSIVAVWFFKSPDGGFWWRASTGLIIETSLRHAIVLLCCCLIFIHHHLQERVNYLPTTRVSYSSTPYLPTTICEKRGSGFCPPSARESQLFAHHLLFTYHLREFTHHLRVSYLPTTCKRQLFYQPSASIYSSPARESALFVLSAMS